MTRSNGLAWINDPADVLNGNPPVQGESAAVTVERTDVDEVAIHATIEGDECAVSTVYLTRAEAALLAAQMTAAALAGEGNGDA